MKKRQKNEMTIKEFFKPTNPFHWWGLILFILGVTIGGAIGGALGAGIGFYLINIGNRKDYSTMKKILISLGLTIAGFIVYVILATIITMLINKWFK